MLEAYIAYVFPGGSNEVRTHHRASLALALNLQHRRTATKQLAALCVEATASTTAVVSIIARLARTIIVASKPRSEEHTSELQSLMRISYAVFFLKKKKNIIIMTTQQHPDRINS